VGRRAYEECAAVADRSGRRPGHLAGTPSSPKTRMR
jgi:hypothetical protein